jgi:predicted N-acetyltransferase YhbS
MLDFTIRRETPQDYAAVEALTREAFWDVYRPGCDEHLIVHKMRASSDCLPALCHVAEHAGRLIGHILYSRAWIEDAAGARREAALFGPISVLPKFQRRGVGSALIRRTLPLARDLGFGGVVITGNPAYYHRFGFDDAAKFGIVMGDGRSMPELMALELKPGGLDGVSGRLRESPLYTTDPQELAAFDRGFPQKA